MSAATLPSPVRQHLRRARVRTLALVGLLGSLILLNGIVYSRSVGFELRLNQRQKEIKRLKEDNSLLRARVDQAQSAARIDHQVTKSLRMQLPERIEYVQVPDHLLDADRQSQAGLETVAWQAPQGY